jgi:hypothetical protein
MQFKILSRGLVAAIGCFAFAGAAREAFAQQNSIFGAGSATGGANGMSTASTGASIQSSAFPTSNFPAPGAAAGGLGGQQGFGQQQGMGGMGAAGQQAGLLGMAGGQLIGVGQAGQNGQMIGQNGQNGMMNNRQGQMGLQNRNNTNRRPGAQNRNQMNNQMGAGAGNQQQKTTVRPQLVVGFDPPRLDVQTTRSSISTRFSKLASESRFKGIEVETDGNTVTLRGEVDSERTGKLAVILARIEPGIKRVRSELTVASPVIPSADADE